MADKNNRNFFSSPSPPPMSFMFSANLNRHNASNNSAAWQANRLWVELFYLPAPITISKITFFLATAVAGSHCGLAICDSLGNILVTSGAIDTSTGSGTLKSVSITPVNLQPGEYYFQFTTDSNLVSVAYFSTASNFTNAVNAVKVRVGSIGNATTGGIPASFNPASLVDTAASWVGGVCALFE